jgi:hypothetical protein
MANDAVDLEALFGPQTTCACEDCRSIHSPAAYFVDTLMFLGKANRDALFGGSQSSRHPNVPRRPDLGEIQLSCANTQTVLPYIDLVNEVLEYAVLMPRNPLTTPVGGWPQTTGNADDLAVNPQWIITGQVNNQEKNNQEKGDVTAYDTLREPEYRWDLPFDLWAEQARAYLGLLTVERAELMRVFRKKLSTTFENPRGEIWWSPTDVDIAAEYLNITPVERRRITNRLSAKTVRAATNGAINLAGVPANTDGVTDLKVGDRVLAKNQAQEAENGIYLVQRGAWVRPPDADATRLRDDGAFVTVSEGDQKGTEWVLTSNVETDKLTFAPFVSAGLPDPSGRNKGHAWGPLPPQATWTDLTSKLKLFLDQSGLSYDELAELLKTRFINPINPNAGKGQNKVVEITFPARKGNNIDELTCDLSLATFDPPLADDAMNRIPRFVRLQRKLGWSTRDLERAIRALLPPDNKGHQPDMTDAFLVQLALIQWFRSELNVDVPTALSWWANLDTLPEADGTPSLYERLFLNSAVIAADPHDDPFALNEDRDELKHATANQTITLHLAGVLAGLGVPATDLTLLLGSVPDLLKLANLSALYRQISFARALGLSVSDFLSLRALSGIDPFNPTKPSDTRCFVEAVRKIKASGFSVAELNYLLRDVSRPADPVAPAPSAIHVVLSEIQAGLRKIISDTSAVTDPTGEITRAKLTALFPNPSPATFVDDAMAFIDTGGTEDASRAKVLDPLGFIKNHFKFLDPNDALKKLTPATALADRYAYALGGYQAFVRRPESESFVKQKLAAALKLDDTIANMILTQTPAIITSGRKFGDPLAGRAALADFLDQITFVAGELPAADDQAFTQLAVVRTYWKLAKVALFLQRLRITVDRLGTTGTPVWLLTHGWLDINALPLDGPSNDSSLFNGWLRAVDFFDVWNGLPPGTPSLYAILDQAQGNAQQPPKCLDDLNGRTGWAILDLQTLAVNGNALGLVWPDDFKDGTFLVRLRDAFALLGRIGVAATQAVQWIQPSVDAATANGIRQAAKAQSAAGSWAQIAKPIQDRLRAKQRDALVSYLLSWKGFADANDVYEWFLIDPQMEPCMLTSRLKQAIGSVQLFIQRTLMKLEDPVPLGAELGAGQAKEWNTWRKSYRIWQAARRIFLYPESYMQIGLRGDETPAFKELKNELQQRDVTLDTVEDAFRHYLESLDQLARLEIMGMYHDTLAETLHVFGRTFATPHIYFYRYQYGGVWSSWEKVNVDFEGEHLIPVVHNHRLYVFWPIFTEKANNADGQHNNTHREIRIAWSEYKNFRWMPKKISSTLQQDLIRAAGPDDKFAPSSLFFFKAFEVITPPAPFDRSKGVVPSAELFVSQHSEKGDLVIAVFERESPNFSVMPIWTAWFRFIGCTEQPTLNLSEAGKTNTLEELNNIVDLVLPGFMNDPPIEYQNYRQSQSGSPLRLPGPNNVEKNILSKVKYPFRILYPHQYVESFTLQDSFFLQDDRRTFLARYLGYGVKPMGDPNKVTLDGIDNVEWRIPYENGQPQAVDPVPSATVSLTDLQSQAKLGISEGSS